MALTLRNTKGSALTHEELDANFTTLDNKVVAFNTTLDDKITMLDTKVNNNVLENASVLVNFSEVNGKVLYNGTEITGAGSGFGQTAAEILAELPSI